MSSIKFFQPADLPKPVAVISNYSYGALENAVALEAQVAAKRINKHLSDVMVSFIDIGFELAAIKKKLPHGEFSKWIVAEFGMSQRTAQNYMNAASLTGAVGSSVVECLPQKLIYELGSRGVPTELAIKVYEKTEAGEPIDVDVVMAEIREAKASGKLVKPTPVKAVKVAPKVKVLSPAATAVSILRQALDKTALAMFRQAFKSADPEEFGALLWKGAKA